MIGKDAPVRACQLPSVRRKSWIRRFLIPAHLINDAHAFFGSTKCLETPSPGNTNGLPLLCRAFNVTTASGDRVTVCGVPFFVFGIRQTFSRRSTSSHRIAQRFAR